MEISPLQDHFIDFTALSWKFGSKSGLRKKPSTQDPIKSLLGNPKRAKPSDGSLIWRPFLETFQHYFRCLLCTFFRCAPILSFFRCGCQTRSQTSAFERRFHVFLGSGRTCENRALVWVLARFRGLEALPNRRIFRTFSCVRIGSHFKRRFM